MILVSYSPAKSVTLFHFTGENTKACTNSTGLSQIFCQFSQDFCCLTGDRIVKMTAKFTDIEQIFSPVLKRC